MNHFTQLIACKKSKSQQTEIYQHDNDPCGPATLQTLQNQQEVSDVNAFKPLRRAIRAKTAYGMTGDGRSHFWARQNPSDPAWDPTFPTSFKLADSPRSSTVWFADEIEEWLERRAKVSRRKAPEPPTYARVNPPIGNHEVRP